MDLTSQRLQSMHAVATNGKSKSMSKYSTNGSSKQRIRKAVEKPICTCQCAVPFRIVLRVAVAFWLLTKQGQDTVLWTIQHENPGNGSKKDWFIEGPKFNASISTSCTKKAIYFLFFHIHLTINISRTPMLQSGMDASLGHWQEAFTTAVREHALEKMADQLWVVPYSNYIDFFTLKLFDIYL